jgi:tetratricopeptide (TPR) repeat protein
MGRDTDAFAAYDSCLTYQSDNASCLNNYAYYLSLEDRDLDRAEEMSYRSIRLEPDNKTFLDTYAWILFMKQRYSEAQRYIDRVCPPDSTDSVLLADESISGVVFEHAGDIAACNQQMEQALRFWTLAQKAGGSGLTAVLPKKIKLKKYIRD